MPVKTETLCPFCERSLSDGDMLRGSCPGCQRDLADANETFDMPAEFEDMWSEREPEDDSISFVPVLPTEPVTPMIFALVRLRAN